jgi:hypothetical protein
MKHTSLVNSYASLCIRQFHGQPPSYIDEVHEPHRALQCVYERNKRGKIMDIILAIFICGVLCLSFSMIEIDYVVKDEKQTWKKFNKELRRKHLKKGDK